MRIIFTLILALIGLNAFSQETYNITGTVKDQFNEEAVGVVIQLNDLSNKYQSGTTTEVDGSFVVENVLPGKYKLVFNLVGTTPVTKEIEISNKSLNLGIVKLGATTTNLKEVNVTATVITGSQSGDTSSFNANAYKVNPDATAEDLVKKMPGIDISGTGEVKAQGEKVQKVLVDGKPFFGEDASSTLKNLPAEVISRIQVYDERSENSRLTGVDDGETVKAINIVTKTEKREGTFGKVYAGGGADMDKTFRYNGGGNINYFKGDRRISLIGQTNNINIQNFSAQDLVGISSSSRGGGRRGGGSSDNFSVNAQNGIARTNAFGFNYSDKLGKKVDLTFSYFFNNINAQNIQDLRRDYIGDVQQRYSEQLDANSKDFNHRINSRLTYNIDSSNTLIWVPSLNLQNNKSQSNMFGITTDFSNQNISQTTNNFESQLSGYNFSNMLMYFHRFKKQGRSFNIRLNSHTSENNGDNKFYAENSFFLSPSLNDTLDQESTLNKNSWRVNGRAEYTEPLTKNSGLQFGLNSSYQEDKSKKLTFDLNHASDAYDLRNDLLSNDYRSSYQTYGGGLRYRFNNSKIRFNAGADLQQALLKSERLLPVSGTIDRKFTNILPRAMMRYSISRSKNLGLFYRTSTDAPSVTELQDVVDNSNPLFLTAGNPLLNQSYTHRLFSRYSSSNSEKNTTFFFMLRGTLTQDYVGRNTLIASQDTMIRSNLFLPRGAQFTTRENMDGYYSLSGFTTYSFPLTALKLNLNLSLNAGYTRTPGIINYEKNFSNNTNTGLGIVVSSNISEKIDFTLTSNTNMNFVRNTLNTNANTRYLNQFTRLNANYIFGEGFVFNTDVTHQLFTGLTSGSNQNFVLWNAGLGKKFLAKQQAEVRLSVFDILGQNRAIEQTFTETYNQTLQNNVLQRYFMLTFTYNIRNFKKGSSEKDAMPQNEDRRGFGPPH